MRSNAKIMRRAKRILKRMDCNLESRAASSTLGYRYELDYVLKKDNTAIAYAHCADEIIKFDPLKNSATTKSVSDWGFSLDSDLFFYLEFGYELVGVIPGIHYEAWTEISECHKDSINYPKGMQRYLHHCKQNRITVDYLREKFHYDGMDVMILYDKAALKAESF